MGMREEVVENILKDNSKTPKHGSGVGDYKRSFKD